MEVQETTLPKTIYLYQLKMDYLPGTPKASWGHDVGLLFYSENDEKAQEFADKELAERRARRWPKAVQVSLKHLSDGFDDGYRLKMPATKHLHNGDYK